jgi:hypothetical protein
VQELTDEHVNAVVHLVERGVEQTIVLVSNESGRYDWYVAPDAALNRKKALAPGEILDARWASAIEVVFLTAGDEMYSAAVLQPLMAMINGINERPK